MLARQCSRRLQASFTTLRRPCYSLSKFQSRRFFSLFKKSSSRPIVNSRKELNSKEGSKFIYQTNFIDDQGKKLLHYGDSLKQFSSRVDKDEKKPSQREKIKNRKEAERGEINLQKSYLSKFKLKASFMARDLKELFINIKRLEFMLILWKNKEFCLRNFKRFKLIMKHIWIEIKKIGTGMKTLHNDVKYSIKTTKDTEMKEYGSYSFTSRVKIRQTWADVFKFVPFSIFIIIPGLDLLIPFYLVIFPNALPSQFQSEAGKNKKLKELVKLQKMSAHKLSKIFPQRLSDALKEREIDPKMAKNITELRRKFQEKDFLTTDLLEYRKIFKVYINFRYAPTKALMTICNMMSLQPITGLNTINNLLKIFRVQIPIDHPAVEWMTRRILFREYSLYMKKLRRDDSYLLFEEIEELDEPTLNRLCFERGLPISILSRNQKLRELKKWHTLSNLRNVPDSLLIYLRVMKFDNIKTYHDRFLDEYHILRRCPHEIYYFEKQKMFEEALAVDDLRKLVNNINENLRTNKNEVKFSHDDLDGYSAFLDRLTDRFSSLDTEIQNTYKFGNLFIEYMENKLIIDYLLDGRQKELEEEAPELADKAKDIYGNEFYYSIPPDKESITEDTKWFKILDSRREEIEKKLQDKGTEKYAQELFA